jgi:TrpR family trp operon transcriptional repressor
MHRNKNPEVNNMISKELENGQEIFSDILTRISDKSLMNQFINEIFTDQEKKNLFLRCALLNLLKSGMTQREISKVLGVSLCKITRGSRILKNPESVINKYMSNK